MELRFDDLVSQCKRKSQDAKDVGLAYQCKKKLVEPEKVQARSSVAEQVLAIQFNPK